MLLYFLPYFPSFYSFMFLYCTAPPPRDLRDSSYHLPIQHSFGLSPGSRCWVAMSHNVLGACAC